MSEACEISAEEPIDSNPLGREDVNRLLAIQEEEE